MNFEKMAILTKKCHYLNISKAIYFYFYSRPGNSERFGAIVCQVPLLDMKRFHLLLAGASWMAEYGNPDKDWEFMKKFSPYQMIQGKILYNIMI